MNSENNLQLAINQRFWKAYEKLLDENKIKSNRDFCEKVGLNEGNFKKYYNGDRKVNQKMLVNMTKHYNVSEEWLLNNKGEMFASPLNGYAKRSDKLIDSQSVPLYAFEASAGLVKLFSNSENVLDYIKIPNLPKCDGAVHISGDSMYPLLKSGDIVMYKQIQDIEYGIIYGEMYLISISVDDDVLTLVKFIQKSELGRDFVKLVSQNQYHSPMDIPKSNIKALGYIKASIRINSMA